MNDEKILGVALMALGGWLIWKQALANRPLIPGSVPFAGGVGGSVTTGEAPNTVLHGHVVHEEYSQ